MHNTLKQKLENGQQPIGIFFDTASEYLMECTGRTGIDFVIIDNEHSPIEAETSARLIRAAENAGVTPLCRVREISRPAILKLLDVGAQGLIIPNVHSVQQVKDIISYARYYPIGQRGFCPSRKDGWGFDGLGSVPETMRHFNGETLLFPQCETAEALAIIEDICAVDGVDGIFDFAIPGQLGIVGYKEGDTITVKLLEIDEKTGKFRLSHRVLEEKPEGWEDRPARRPRREGGDREHRGPRREHRD